MDNNAKNMPWCTENLPETKLPENLHNKVISDLFFLKFKYALLAAVAILPINLLFLGWHIWLNAAEADTFTLLTAMFNDFEISYDFVSEFARTIIDTIPFTLIIAFTLNLLLLVYLLINFQSTLKNLSFIHMSKR